MPFSPAWTRETRGRLARVAFVATAAVAVLGGIAYACTTFGGKLTVTGNGSSPGSVNASGDGSAGKYWCVAPNGTARVNSNSSGTVNVTVAAAPSGAPCFGDTLPANTYTIRWTTGTWDEDGQSGSNCMATTALGTFSVSASGTGSATSSSFNPGGPGTISVCVTDPGAGSGNQVPVSVV